MDERQGWGGMAVDGGLDRTEGLSELDARGIHGWSRQRRELSGWRGLRSMRHLQGTNGGSGRDDDAVAVVYGGSACTGERVDGDGRERTEMWMRVKELMDEMRRWCALCWWHGRWENHELQHCGYAHGHCLRCLDRGHKVCDCVKVGFPRGKVCFWCGFPQKLGGQHVHGEARTGTCAPGLEDKVGLVCWSSWCEPRTRVRMESEFERTWTGDEFREWMGRVETKGVTNGVSLFLWLWDECQREVLQVLGNELLAGDFS